MTVEWKKGRGDVSLSQLGEFEAKYQVSFPDTYKALVVESNGGYPNKTLFNVSNGREAVFESLINWDQSRKANIYFWMDTLNLDKVVPFGKDPFGNLICFDFRESVKPSVKFWDHEIGEFYAVSSDWHIFLDSLSE
jgi:hypothetical protein